MTMSEVSDRNEGDALYEEDFAAWLDVQASALRERDLQTSTSIT